VHIACKCQRTTFSLNFVNNVHCYHLSCKLVTVSVALMKPAVQSDTYLTDFASLAVDANMDTHSCTVAYTSTEPWWSVDLGTPMDVGRVCVTNDFDPTYGQRIDVFKKMFFGYAPSSSSSSSIINIRLIKVVRCNLNQLNIGIVYTV